MKAVIKETTPPSIFQASDGCFENCYIIPGI